MKCDRCRTRWCIGTNLFTGWQHVEAEEDPEGWAAIASGAASMPFLEEYRKIQGDLPPWVRGAFERENDRAYTCFLIGEASGYLKEEVP